MANSNGGSGGFLKEFGEFLSKGNVVDLAVAVIIGGAFGKIVTSLVEDIITPAILNPAMKAAGVDQLSQLSINGIKYGLFLAAVLNFIVIAFVIFLMIRSIEKARRKLQRQQTLEEAETAAPDPTVELTAALHQLDQTIRTQGRSI
ncbi:Large-conductance mechanosensitive channel [Acaryochloris thomasi RCC1774]|uniref:Large-conductance mechanosensitive channel n=1 Tax=Acaryochloris thomasi RCC1774 TaxID=1764569 RepID=A0A2W1JNI0_9CYAN|nr:large conductance mechanosensitive channel protein MscL [Acaryochloris thomasi]PZD74849.1 Large-conductance mechanosensitive channel [Acaryochloris thomasi RCC1774]